MHRSLHAGFQLSGGILLPHPRYFPAIPASPRSVPPRALPRYRDHPHFSLRRSLPQRFHVRTDLCWGSGGNGPVHSYLMLHLFPPQYIPSRGKIHPAFSRISHRLFPRALSGSVTMPDSVTAPDPVTASDPVAASDPGRQSGPIDTVFSYCRPPSGTPPDPR